MNIPFFSFIRHSIDALCQTVKLSWPKLIFVLILAGVVIVIDETGGTTDLVYTAIAGLGALPFITIGIFSTFQGVVNAVRTLSDEPINYRPWSSFRPLCSRNS